MEDFQCNERERKRVIIFPGKVKRITLRQLHRIIIFQLPRRPIPSGAIISAQPHSLISLPAAYQMEFLSLFSSAGGWAPGWR